MPEDGKFIETGLKNLATVATLANPVLGGAVSAAATLVGLLNWFAGDDTKTRLKELAEQQRKLEQQLDRMRDSLGAFIQQDAAAHNNAKFAALRSKVHRAGAVLDRLETENPDIVACAIDLGRIADEFIDASLDGNPYDPFLWYDTGERPLVYDDGEPMLDAEGRQKTEVVFLPNRFKSLPTLPFYLTTLLGWLAARELVVDAGRLAQLPGDRARLERHIAATGVRDGFHAFEQFYLLRLQNNPDALSLTELVMLHVRSQAVISSKYPGDDGLCRYHYRVVDGMRAEQVAITPEFTFPQADRNAFCAVPAEGMPTDEELAAEAAAGSDALVAAHRLLDNAYRTGRAGGQQVWPFFAGAIPYPELFYVVKHDGSVDWLKLLPSQDVARFEGPRGVARGWDRFDRIVPAGGPAMYGVTPSGDMIWTSHDGVADGAPLWTDERRVGWGWNDFVAVLPAGNGIIYALRPDGELLWYRHRGFRDGGDVSTWDGPVALERPILFRPRQGPLSPPSPLIPRPWTSFRHIVPMGDTALYVVDGRGDLYWLRHDGARNGTAGVSGGQRVGVGWGGFQTILASPPGRVYAIRPDGGMVHYQHRGWATGGDIDTWDAPVEIGGGWGGHRQVFILAPVDARIR